MSSVSSSLKEFPLHSEKLWYNSKQKSSHETLDRSYRLYEILGGKEHETRIYWLWQYGNSYD